MIIGYYVNIKVSVRFAFLRLLRFVRNDLSVYRYTADPVRKLSYRGTNLLTLSLRPHHRIRIDGCRSPGGDDRGHGVGNYR